MLVLEVLKASGPAFVEQEETSSDLYVPLHVDEEPTMWGEAIPRSSVALFPAGKYAVCRVNGPMTWGVLSFDVWGEAGEEPAQSVLHPSPAQLKRLQSLLPQVVAISEAAATTRMVASAVEAVADAAQEAMQAAEIPRPAPSREVATETVAAAMAVVRENEVTSITEIVNDIGASRSSLYRAFDRVVGVSPYEWVQMYRLAQIRRRLLRAKPGPGVVSREAADLGVFHLGNLARNYRKRYGELPSETLHRT